MDSLDSFLATATAAADAARAVTTRHFRAEFTVESKSDNSPVTVADFEAERCIKEIILNRHPRHSFLGEETGAAGGIDGDGNIDTVDGDVSATVAGDSDTVDITTVNTATVDGDVGDGDTGDGDVEWRWVIDPIDGTKAFATGNPTFGTLIALLHHGRPLIGVIDHAGLDARLVGVDGRATTCNGAQCKASNTARLKDASLYATSIDLFTGADLTAFNRLSAACRFRVFGGDCHCYTLLARGFTDLVCEARLKPHDFLALSPIIKGAGGVITDWQGAPLTLQSTGHVLAAANQQLHQAALTELNR